MELIVVGALFAIVMVIGVPYVLGGMIWNWIKTFVIENYIYAIIGTIGILIEQKIAIPKRKEFNGRCYTVSIIVSLVVCFIRNGFKISFWPIAKCLIAFLIFGGLIGFILSETLIRSKEQKKIEKELKVSEKYQNALIEYNKHIEEFNNIPSDLYNYRAWMKNNQQRIRKIDIRCLEKSIVLLIDFADYFKYKDKLTIFDTQKELKQLFKESFNEDIDINGENVVDKYIELIGRYVNNTYLKIDLNDIDNYQMYHEYNDAYIRLMKKDGAYIDLPASAYNFINKKYPELEKKQ